MKFPSLFVLTALSAIAAADSFDLPVLYSRSGVVRTGHMEFPKLSAPGDYSFLFSVPPSALTSDAQIFVEVREGERPLIRKTLHPGDADLYAPFHLASGKANLRLEAKDIAGRYELQINRLPASAQLKKGSNHTWQSANPIRLGETVFASSDELEYIPVGGQSRRQYATDLRGEDWYKFRFESPRPRLVFFQLELTDRDDLPVDVSILREREGRMEEFTRGQDPVSVPHEVQALPGNKFAPRVLTEPGEYYVRVRANHPEYKLRTRIYDAPPYADPHEAVRTAVDYIMGAGDSWFANTPRRGGTLDRITPVHQETSLCVSCHPAHFSQRAQLYAKANGYPIVQRQQLQFLEERFYNTPRPFYGFEKDGAVWTRVISAPANVLSRMSLLTSMFETNVSQQPRPDYHSRIKTYLDLYYAGRDQLPPDETNGNTPLVSTFEVAWYSWKTTHDVRLPAMISSAPVKNIVDLCYQTLALADIDSVKYRSLIDSNANRILSLQRPDGQWSMLFDLAQPAVEFQTGHALWALAAAGITLDNPQVKKAVDFLMPRQQSFGGWMDPLQSFENFRTPFRETQFAVLALSAYYPLKGDAKGWNSPVIGALSSDPVQQLKELDDIWDAPSARVREQIDAAMHSNEVLIRQASAEAAGRVALPSSIPVLATLLGDRSKLVQRTAAWSLRQIYANHPEVSDAEIVEALDSHSDRTRWGATRIFAHHFSTLAVDDRLVSALATRAASEPVVSVRMQAIRGLWQSWFWNADDHARNTIEDTLLAGLGRPSDQWIATNLRAAVYNLADENIRYLYNNWVGLLPAEQDRVRAVKGRLTIESRLAGKFATVLEQGAESQKKELLIAITDVKQRRADIYDLDSDLSSEATPVYNRIGNDIEQIAFFGSSADRVARAITPLLTSQDPEMRKLTRMAALLVRETPYVQTEKLAGNRGPDTLQLGRRLDQMPDAVEISKSFHLPAAKPAAPPSTAPVVAAVTARPQLDEAWFRLNVQPILERKGEDGYACINCHATHTLFNATWSTVMNVVDTRNPENSLLLRKPTSTAESEGVAGAKTTAHGGGRRWDKNSPQYQTILQWIQGAALKPAQP